jgi:hypothetical protein
MDLQRNIDLRPTKGYPLKKTQVTHDKYRMTMVILYAANTQPFDNWQ